MKVMGIQYHETQITPLVEKISVHIDTIWFAQVLGDDGADGRQIFSFQGMFVLDVAKLGWYVALCRFRP